MTGAWLAAQLNVYLDTVMFTHTAHVAGGVSAAKDIVFVLIFNCNIDLYTSHMTEMEQCTTRERESIDKVATIAQPRYTDSIVLESLQYTVSVKSIVFVCSLLSLQFAQSHLQVLDSGLKAAELALQTKQCRLHSRHRTCGHVFGQCLAWPVEGAVLGGGRTADGYFRAAHLVHALIGQRNGGPAAARTRL